MNTDNIVKYLAPGISQRNWKMMPDEYVRMVVNVEKPRMKKLTDFYTLAELFFVTPEYDAALLHFKSLESPATAENLHEILKAGTGLSPEPGVLIKELEAILERLSTSSGKGPVYWPLRVALSGQKASPGPLEIATILGKDETLRRVTIAIGKLQAA